MIIIKKIMKRVYVFAYHHGFVVTRALGSMMHSYTFYELWATRVPWNIFDQLYCALCLVCSALFGLS